MTLYLFTSTYPFGTAETFLEDEIVFLSNEFEKIEIIPLYGDDATIRKTPVNCKVHKPIIRNFMHKCIQGLFSRQTFRLFASDFFNQRVYNNTLKLRTWLIAYMNTNCIVKSTMIRNIEKKLIKDDICYFYWGKGCNILSIFWKGKAHFVSRYHGEWDLWEESSGNYAPIRNVLASSLDLAVFISQKGESYFHKRYPQCKTAVCRLGAFGNGITAKSQDNIVRVLTCSAVYPLKRVSLILESLKNATELNIEWTHIGSGIDFGKLQQMAETVANERCKIMLVGNCSHFEVIDYYKSHKVDLFMNLSMNEGIPVSIMEAISFDIPIVATDVGGTSEIVTEMSGVLIDANPTIEQIVDAIYYVLSHKYRPYEFWRQNYDASINYAAFAKLLTSLRND